MQAAIRLGSRFFLPEFAELREFSEPIVKREMARSLTASFVFDDERKTVSWETNC